jgi:RNA polymerase sigma factor FliA
MLALVLAARSFDATLGVPFGAFAALRIRGALIDALRGLDSAGRGLRGKAREIDSVHNTLAATLGCTPTRLELAQAMGVAVSELDGVAADVRRATPISLQALTPDSVEESLPTPSDNPEQLLLKREQIGYLHDAIAELPDRLRIIVERSFFDQHRMADIAADLGVTESRVSQLRSEAFALLRAALHAMDRENSTNFDVPQRRSRLAKQENYIQAVASRSTVANRLAATSLLGEPRPLLTAAS